MREYEGLLSNQIQPLNLLAFWQLGREQRIGHRHPLVKLFTWLMGPLGINSRIRNAHVLHVINRLSLPESISILDAGCGQAEALFWLAKRHPKWKLVGAEFDAQRVETNKKIAHAQQLSNLQFRQQSLTDMSDEMIYDVALSMDVLEHIEDDQGALMRIKASLKPDGVLILHLPRRNAEAWRFLAPFRKYTTPDHVRPEYTTQEIERLLQNGGFKIIEMRATYSKLGELAFELNYLCWQKPALRAALALLTYPLAFILAFFEVQKSYSDGNAFIITAVPL